MSALSGFFGERPIDLAAYYEGHSLLWRRGPHDEGFFVGPTLKSDEPTLARGNRTSDVFQNHPHILELKKSLFCLGQHHLKTIDPTAGDHQPLQTREGRYTLIFDGEIYNFNDLRLELMNLGHVFATASDTEVFLAAYSEWGENSFNKCNGQWAAVIYDSQEKTFVFSRDRLGEKPLYYSKVDNQIFFASEFKFFKSLNKAGALPLTLNKKAASIYLKYGYLNFDHTTFYNEINAVKPGYCYFFSSQGKLLSAKKFWSLDLKYKSGLSFDVAKDHLKDLLISAVEIREVESKAPFKMSNRELDPFPSAVEDQILKISEIAEQPLSALAVCCAVQLSNRGKSGSLLLDEGKNWLWAGHPSHFSLHMKDQLKKGNLKPLIQNMALKISQGQKAFEAVSQRWMALNTSRKESRDSLFFQAPEEPHFLPQSLDHGIFKNITFSPLPENLYFLDRFGMYFSSPIRLPYLDHRLIEFAFSLPSEMKIKEGQGEYVLKAALKEESTGSVLNVVQNFSPTHSLNIKALQKKVIFSPDLASLYSQREIEELYGRNERNAFSETDEILWRVFAFKLWLVN